MTDHPECWQARGVGSEYNLVCLVTGKTADLMPNVSGFVQGREAGARVVALFNGRARLDFRKHEPDWVQVKVGCLPEHEEVLHRLCAASWGCHGLLNERIVKWAIDPVQFPGGEPKALARANANSLEAASLRAKVDDLTAALKAALPYLDNGDSPGGCNGKHPECGHCAAIAKVQKALAVSRPHLSTLPPQKTGD